jgi:hypothetical protein
MELLLRICEECKNHKGGIILDKLYKITNE